MNKEELLKDDFAIDTINDIIAERDGYMQQVKDLESNWKALKEWLDEQLMYFKENNEQSGFSTNVEDLEMVLDKMNSLEGDK